MRCLMNIIVSANESKKKLIAKKEFMKKRKTFIAIFSSFTLGCFVSVSKRLALMERWS